MGLLALVPGCQSSIFCGTMITIIRLYQIRESDGIEHGMVVVVVVALRPKSTAMVIAGRSVHLTTLFPGQA